MLTIRSAQARGQKLEAGEQKIAIESTANAEFLLFDVDRWMYEILFSHQL